MLTNNKLYSKTFIFHAIFLAKLIVLWSERWWHCGWSPWPLPVVLCWSIATPVLLWEMVGSAWLSRFPCWFVAKFRPRSFGRLPRLLLGWGVSWLDSLGFSSFLGFLRLCSTGLSAELTSGDSLMTSLTLRYIGKEFIT